jgi:predicted RecB family endonuclease
MTLIERLAELRDCACDSETVEVLTEAIVRLRARVPSVTAKARTQGEALHRLIARIQRLHGQGESISAISRKVKKDRSTVLYHLRKELK